VLFASERYAIRRVGLPLGVSLLATVRVGGAPSS
jgi:hypothetical protein